MQIASPFDTVAPAVQRFRDTCNVYVLRSGRDAVLVDFGSGAVLDALGALGVDRVTDVLVTHHHRDQVQGLARAAAAGIRIWVPPVERHLIEDASAHWQARQLDNDYDLREDKFTLLESVPVAGSAAEYRTASYGGVEAYTLPTPGHTAGSVTYLVEVEGSRVAFCGDLVYGDGKLWSLAATQWSYSGAEGLIATHVSCAVLADAQPDVLLPSHGEPVGDPPGALTRVRSAVQELVDLRLEQTWDLADLHRRPWKEVTPHLLRNRAAFANSYALVSESGAALFLDFGYDVTTGLVPRTQREARRPLLWPLDALRRDHGVERIEAVIPTHYHDDHVAGLELLRAVEGTEVWAPENVAPILVEPARHDLPCLWFEPIAVDRVLPFGEPVQWHEYQLRLHPLPGHTLYAAAIELEVDGKRVLATGDQQGGGGRPILNYQYRNRYRVGDFEASAELYRSLRPDLILSGHASPQQVTDELLEGLLADAQRLEGLHRDVLPTDDVDLGAEGFAARIEPYRSTARAGARVELAVVVRNPFAREAVASVALATPQGWTVPEPQEATLPPHGVHAVRFDLTAGAPERRARIAADVTVDGVRFGQHAEALVDVA